MSHSEAPFFSIPLGPLHVSHIPFYHGGTSGPTHMISPGSCWCAHILSLSIYFFTLRLQFPFKFVCKSSSLPPTPFPFFQVTIDESRVFVCSDQYFVMKATLQSPAKASVAACSSWIFLYFLLLWGGINLGSITVYVCVSFPL